MTDGPPDVDVDEADALHHAVLGLHALAGTFGDGGPGLIPGFGASSIGAKLQMVADAPKAAVPDATRLDLLHALARAGFPGYESHESEYRSLAVSFAADQSVDPDGLLDDLMTSAQANLPFAKTSTGQALDHHLAAFIGQDVCTIRRVTINQRPATWIFSEFETDAPFENVAGWVDPRSWPVRGPMLFKKMELVGTPQPVNIGVLGSEHWHGVFHERVQLIQPVNTFLHCDFWRSDDESAGMTYELSLSLDGALDVDRGFLLVNNLGPVRRVKALKIVGFTNPGFDSQAQTVCPYWTDWVRSAVEGGSTSTPVPPGHVPSGGNTSAQGPIADLMTAWVEFFGDSAGEYIALFQDFFTRVRTTDYGVSSWVEDATSYWDRLATDWARAWTYGMDLVDDIAVSGLAADFGPPGDQDSAAPESLAASAAGAAASTATSEGTLIPVAGLVPADQPSCGPLTAIELGDVAIQPSEVSVSVEQLEDGSYGVRLSTTNSALAPGLYVGDLLAADGRRLGPVQLYLSRATAG